MSFFEILETLLIGPLKLVFEIIFSVANRLIGHPGLAIIALSLVMNILVLPLYRRADAMQEEARDIDAKLHDGVAHIKKTFSGDERMMVLQAYYRQNNYKPTDALRGSVSLLLEIPFFMAAYQFLSHVEILNGVSFGPIADLGAPDGLLVIGALTINVLPFLMTLINVVSSAIFLKGFPMKTKVQLYGMALFFLVFLYNSPSCLVFYWTLNNLFSLVKTIFYKLKNPRLVLRILTFAIGIAVVVFGLFVYESISFKRKLFLIGIGLLLMIPMVLPFIVNQLFEFRAEREASFNKKQFVLGCLFMTVLVGVLIPSAYIASSPQEYVNVNLFRHPLWYVVSSGSLAAGTFLIWMQVFYWLASPKGKELFDKLVWVMCGVMIVNYMFFDMELGVISAALQYSEFMVYTARDQLMNLAVLLCAALILYAFAVKLKQHVALVLLTAMIAISGMSALNIGTIKSSVDKIYFPDETETAEYANFTLSKNGKNVVVLMIDRAMGEYIPYLFNEKPELQDAFSGFTYYPNTISFGMATNFGSPPLLGGYEYTPIEMNKRDKEPLVDKHNEALKVMPVLFYENGYEVTVCDPPYANYQWIPDLSIYDAYPEIKTYVTDGKVATLVDFEQVIRNNDRNFFCFALMKTMPLCLQPTLYDHGLYNQVASEELDTTFTKQVVSSISTATGISTSFTEPYEILGNLPGMTRITEADTNTYMFMCNDTAHEVMLLQEPAYEPTAEVDNTQYDAENSDRFHLNGKTLKITTVEQMSHYQSNMAVYLQLAKWFDYLREQGVYDNTRIILVADHGRDLHHFDELEMDNGMGGLVNVELFYPLLMVKDFDSSEFKVSDEFMTNADVPTLATEGLIERPRNPFTGKAINSDDKYAHEQFITLSGEWQIGFNNGNTFAPSVWASVKDNLWEQDNWSFYYDKSISLSDHAAP